MCHIVHGRTCNGNFLLFWPFSYWIAFEFTCIISDLFCLRTGDRIKYIGPSVQVESDDRSESYPFLVLCLKEFSMVFLSNALVYMDLRSTTFLINSFVKCCPVTMLLSFCFVSMHGWAFFCYRGLRRNILLVLHVSLMNCFIIVIFYQCKDLVFLLCAKEKEYFFILLL